MVIFQMGHMFEIPRSFNTEGKKSKLQTLVVAQKIDIYEMLLFSM